MKKFTAIICTMAMLAALTGCGSSGTTSESVPDNRGDASAPKSSSPEASSPESSGASESAPDSSPVSEEQNKLSAEALSILEKYDEKTLTNNVFGIPLSEEDIVDAYYKEDSEVDIIEYGAGFYRIARPMYNTASGSDSEELAEGLREKMDEFDEDPENIPLTKVKVGDVLENGLTVKEAKTLFGCTENGSFFWESCTAFEGRLTMEGVLFREVFDHDYTFSARDLTFYPDCSKTAVPSAMKDYSFGLLSKTDGTFVSVITDSNVYRLGNLDEMDFDESGIFGDENVVTVKVTLDNIRLICDEFGGCTAEIVDIERIDE